MDADVSDWRRHVGRRVTRAEFDEPWFLERERELAERRRIHRKLWEFVALAQVYHDTISHGGRVLGFGVGREPLPAWFAARGADVLATDKPEPDYWKSDQYANGLDEVVYEGICDARTFRKQVAFQKVDMLAIPEELKEGKFNFTWSASCFEHLGSIEKGLNFFVEQMRCLAPGGIAAHVTEYNTESNAGTLQAWNIVAFRLRDLEELKRRLAAQGDALWPLDVTCGTAPEDAVVDDPPFDEREPHLSLRLAGYAFTSLMIVASRGR